MVILTRGQTGNHLDPEESDDGGVRDGGGVNIVQPIALDDPGNQVPEQKGDDDLCNAMIRFMATVQGRFEQYSPTY